MPTPKTQDLPGVDGPGVGVKKIKSIDAAVDTWRDIVEQRMALTKKEVEARQKVVDLMHKANITVYPYGDDKQVCLIAGQEKVKVKTLEEGGDPDPEPEE